MKRYVLFFLILLAGTSAFSADKNKAFAYPYVSDHPENLEVVGVADNPNQYVFAVGYKYNQNTRVFDPVESNQLSKVSIHFKEGFSVTVPRRALFRLDKMNGYTLARLEAGTLEFSQEKETNSLLISPPYIFNPESGKTRMIVSYCRSPQLVAEECLTSGSDRLSVETGTVSVQDTSNKSLKIRNGDITVNAGNERYLIIPR